MSINYGEVRCPSKRPHFKKRKNTQIEEKFCDKLIGFVNPDNPCDVIMFCSSCKSFIKVINTEGVLNLSITKDRIPTTNITGIVHEHF